MIGNVLSKMLFGAREQIDMWADVVEGRTGSESTTQRTLVAEIDAFRKARGWSAGGFGIPPEGTPEVEGVEYTREAVEEIRELVIALRDGALEAERMDYAVGLSHAIAYLAEFAEVMPKRRTT